MWKYPRGASLTAKRPEIVAPTIRAHGTPPPPDAGELVLTPSFFCRPLSDRGARRWPMAYGLSLKHHLVLLNSDQAKRYRTT